MKILVGGRELSWVLGTNWPGDSLDKEKIFVLRAPAHKQSIQRTLFIPFWETVTEEAFPGKVAHDLQGPVEYGIRQCWRRICHTSWAVVGLGSPMEPEFIAWVLRIFYYHLALTQRYVNVKAIFTVVFCSVKLNSFTFGTSMIIM